MESHGWAASGPVGPGQPPSATAPLSHAHALPQLQAQPASQPVQNTALGLPVTAPPSHQQQLQPTRDAAASAARAPLQQPRYSSAPSLQQQPVLSEQPLPTVPGGQQQPRARHRSPVVYIPLDSPPQPTARVLPCTPERAVGRHVLVWFYDSQVQKAAGGSGTLFEGSVAAYDPITHKHLLDFPDEPTLVAHSLAEEDYIVWGTNPAAPDTVVTGPNSRWPAAGGAAAAAAGESAEAEDAGAAGADAAGGAAGAGMAAGAAQRPLSSRLGGAASRSEPGWASRPSSTEGASQGVRSSSLGAASPGPAGSEGEVDLEESPTVATRRQRKPAAPWATAPAAAPEGGLNISLGCSSCRGTACARCRKKAIQELEMHGLRELVKQIGCAACQYRETGCPKCWAGVLQALGLPQRGRAAHASPRKPGSRRVPRAPVPAAEEDDDEERLPDPWASLLPPEAAEAAMKEDEAAIMLQLMGAGQQPDGGLRRSPAVTASPAVTTSAPSPASSLSRPRGPEAAPQSAAAIPAPGGAATPQPDAASPMDTEPGVPVAAPVPPAAVGPPASQPASPTSQPPTAASPQPARAPGAAPTTPAVTAGLSGPATAAAAGPTPLVHTNASGSAAPSVIALQSQLEAAVRVVQGAYGGVLFSARQAWAKERQRAQRLEQENAVLRQQVAALTPAAGPQEPGTKLNRQLLGVGEEGAAGSHHPHVQQQEKRLGIKRGLPGAEEEDAGSHQQHARQEKKLAR